MEAQASYFTDIMSKTPIDNSTADVSWAEYRTSDLNISSGNTQSTEYYQIVVKDTDQWLLMSKAYLRVQCSLAADSAGTVPVNGQMVTLAAAGASVFSRMELLANDSQIDICDNCQFVQLVNALMNYNRDKIDSVAESEWLSLDFGEQALGVKSASATYLGVNGSAFTGSSDQVFDHSSGSAVSTGFVPAAAATPNIAGSNHPFHNAGFALRWNKSRNGRLFEFCIPLSSVFGFCRDIQSVHRGILWTLNLQKNTRPTSIMHGAGAHGGVVVTTSGVSPIIRKVSMWVPQITPSIDTQRFLEQTLATSEPSHQFFENVTARFSDEYPTGSTDVEWLLPLEGHKPTRIMIGLQRRAQYNNIADVAMMDGADVALSDQTHSNPSCFSHLGTYTKSSRTVTGGLSEAELRVNDKSLPREKYRLDFSDSSPDYSRAYTDFLRSTGKYADESGSAVSYKDYKDLYPLIAYDLRDYADVFSGIKTNDIRFRCRISNGSPDAFRIVAVIYSERELLVQAIGGKISLRV